MNGNKMPSLNDLKTAVRRGDTEEVERLANELNENGVNFESALTLAENKNRVTRGEWQDIVDILSAYFSSDDE
jgi:hypothetical protein